MGQPLSYARPKSQEGRGRRFLGSPSAAAVSILLAIFLDVAVAADEFLAKLPPIRLVQAGEANWDEAELVELMQVALATKRHVEEAGKRAGVLHPALNAAKKNGDFSELTHVLLATWLANRGDLAESGEPIADPSRPATIPPPAARPKTPPNHQVAALEQGDNLPRPVTDVPIVTGPLPKRQSKAPSDETPAPSENVKVAALPPADHVIEPEPKKKAVNLGAKWGQLTESDWTTFFC